MNKMDRFWTKVGRTLTDWRLLGALFVVTVAVSLWVSIDAADTARFTAQDNRRRTTAQNRETMVVAHAQCLRVNDARRRVRAYLGEAVRLAFKNRLPGQPPITPEERVALDALAKSISDAGISILAKTDCVKAAPLPPNLTTDERDQLPKPEPIDIPGDP